MHAAAATRVLCCLIRDSIRHNVVSQCCVAMLCLWWVYTWCIYVPPAFHLDSIGNEQPAADCPLHGLHPVPYIRCQWRVCGCSGQRHKLPYCKQLLLMYCKIHVVFSCSLNFLNVFETIGFSKHPSASCVLPVDAHGSTSGPRIHVALC